MIVWNEDGTQGFCTFNCGLARHGHGAKSEGWGDIKI